MPKSYPGVYVEEISGRTRTIMSVTTSTAAFVGEADSGPLDKALLITNFSDFQKTYGNPLKGRWLAHAAQQFFANGGTRLYIARVTAQPGSVLSASPLDEKAYQRAFKLLDALDDINLIAVPGIGTATMVSYGAEYCRKRRDCFFIADMPLSDNTVNKAKQFIKYLTVKNSYAAVYFPWLEVKDIVGKQSGNEMIPPSGTIAGLYARTDASRSVWKAPAGAEATLTGIVGLSKYTSDQEQDTLNPLGVNVIRNLKNRGIVAFGARTQGTKTKPEFRYVPVRRTAIFIEQSIGKSLGWAAFEPNNETLWSQLRNSISHFMNQLFRQGAFQGATQEQAYFVKCDRETTTQADIDQGMVNIEIGFAPLKPAEFIVLHISQKTSES